MTDDSDKPTFTPNLVLEQGTLRNYTLHKGKKNSEGELVEDPAIELRIRFPVDRVERYLGLLTKVWKLEKGLTAGLAFVEQMELMARKETAEKNGSGPAPDQGGLTPIDGKRGKKKREKEGAAT